MTLAAYFPISSYGASDAAYLGFGGSVSFLAGLALSYTPSNLPARAVRLYGAFRPGVVRTTTVLSAFPVIWGQNLGLTYLDNIAANTTGTPTPNKVPPYGNSFIFT